MTVVRLPIQIKITILSFGVVLFSICIGGTFLLGNIKSIKEEEIEKRSMIVARTVAQVPEIKNNLTKPYGWIKIYPVVEEIRIVNNVDYIVVLNNEKIRYSHPIKSMLGSISYGSDEGPAFAEHTYTSKAKGELGIAVRAFVPIINDNHEQIGVVIVGNILPTYLASISEIKYEIGVVMFLTLLLGIFGAWLLAKHIKEQMFELEPHEIVRLLVERTATFHAINEGLIAIDNQEMITIFNEKAKQMLNIHGDVVGKNIREVVPDTKLPEMLQLEHPIYNQEIQIQYTNIMSSRIPIKVDHKIVGAVAVFQDRTEVTMMAEELTGVKAFVEALRVQNHEHMNKLHTIAGLIQLGEQEQALNYVYQISEEQVELTRFLSKSISNQSIAGLLLSKVSRGKELGIRVNIDRSSILEHFPNHIDHHDFVLILGNLIENAFKALQKKEIEDKEVYVSIYQNEEICEVLIEDNGIGMSASIQEQIFKEGFTTNQDEGYGLGLYMVKNIIEKGNGEMNMNSQPEKGASFFIQFRMNQKKTAGFQKVERSS
ncbi:ATP-binding protein [Chengkuizengella axinellae]|uniref:histidine kinase n=1 Tax=Chengkuizengella axinellae TaxID=3064388 RepID=A0ABT9J4F5_9BACL|nr:sensor histidine kinase [Chengkuizengella sp. 2205SS18-9]MDP5276507.1 sensor histidine kinase [Chengkuizengella sp. 2205SS18-9]